MGLCSGVVKLTCPSVASRRPPVRAGISCDGAAHLQEEGAGGAGQPPGVLHPLPARPLQKEEREAD